MTVTYLWAKLTGPGTVTFVNSAAASTHASFSVAGVYILQLTVTVGSTVGVGYIKVVVLNLSSVPSADPTLTEQNP